MGDGVGKGGFRGSSKTSKNTLHAYYLFIYLFIKSDRMGIYGNTWEYMGIHWNAWECMGIYGTHYHVQKTSNK